MFYLIYNILLEKNIKSIKNMKNSSSISFNGFDKRKKSLKKDILCRSSSSCKLCYWLNLNKNRFPKIWWGRWYVWKSIIMHPSILWCWWCHKVDWRKRQKIYDIGVEKFELHRMGLWISCNKKCQCFFGHTYLSSVPKQLIKWRGLIFDLQIWVRFRCR